MKCVRARVLNLKFIPLTCGIFNLYRISRLVQPTGHDTLINKFKMANLRVTHEKGYIQILIFLTVCSRTDVNVCSCLFPCENNKICKLD